jgi:alanyl aminopeptidase
VQAGDSLTAMGTFVYLLDDHSLLYEWLDKNFDRVVAKAPSYYQPQMPQVMAGSCEQRNLDRLKAFFKDRGDRYAASLEKAVEREEACIARKKRHLESLNRFLEQQHGGE